MQTHTNILGSIKELQNSLAYQQHLFNASRKEGANFEVLKKIHLRIKELQKDMQALKQNGNASYS